MKLRRKLSFGLLIALAVLAGWAGLLWHRDRQAAKIVDSLRFMGAKVSERAVAPDWWKDLATAVGVVPERGPLARMNLTVILREQAANPDSVREATRHPGLETLLIFDAPKFDDNAFGVALNCSTATNLNLTRLGIGDAGLRRLAGWKNLRSVTVEDCGVTDEGIRFLCGLPSVEAVMCAGRGIKAVALHDLALTGPDGEAPAAGKPVVVKGRLGVATPPRAGTVITVQASQIAWASAYKSAFVVAAPENSYAFTAPLADNLASGTTAVFIEVWLSGPPYVGYQFPAVKFEVPTK